MRTRTPTPDSPRRQITAVSNREQSEPRLATVPHCPAIDGLDLDQLRPGQTAVVDERAVGYPVQLSALPSGAGTTDT